jgi:zinc transporter, ZIP family
MENIYLTIAVSIVMGLAVFISMPIVFYKKLNQRRMLLFNSIAIGILAFLLMDIYGDVAAIFGNDTITSPIEIIFLVGFAVSFLFFIMPRESRDPEESPKRTSILAAIGIGFQNLTEGLVFGSAGAAGLLPIYVLSAIGFTVQNMTEGFPIAAPLFGSKEKMEKKFLTMVFLIGGLPTIFGTLIGLVFYSNTFIVFFDALASAAILYVILVLFHVNIMRGLKSKEGIKSSMWITYLGILIGFVIAYVVNYVVVA